MHLRMRCKWVGSHGKDDEGWSGQHSVSMTLNHEAIDAYHTKLNTDLSICPVGLEDASAMSSIKPVRSETPRSWNLCFFLQTLWWVCFETLHDLCFWNWTIKANAVSNATKCCLNFTQVWVLKSDPSLDSSIRPIQPKTTGSKVKMQWPLRRFWKSIPRQEWKHAETLPASYFFCELQNMGRYVMQTSFGSVAWKSCWLETGSYKLQRNQRKSAGCWLLSKTENVDFVSWWPGDQGGVSWHWKCWLVQESWRTLSGNITNIPAWRYAIAQEFTIA